MEDDLKFIQDTLQYVSDLICKWKSEAQEKIVKYEAMDEDIREKCKESFNRIFNVYAENIEKFEKKELELRKTITDILVKERDFIQTRTCAQGYKKELKK
jgi:predicted secreted protein